MRDVASPGSRWQPWARTGAVPSSTARSTRPTATRSDKRVAVLPFRVNSTGSLRFLSEPLDELLAQRIETGGEVSAIAKPGLTASGQTEIPGADGSDESLRAWAAKQSLDGVVVGSLTELAGRFSIDVRVIPTAGGAGSTSLVLTAGSDRELLDRLGELAERVSAAVVGGKPDRIVEIRVEGADSIEAELRDRLTVRRGEAFDAAKLEVDRRAIATDPRVARVLARTQQSAGRRGRRLRDRARRAAARRERARRQRGRGRRGGDPRQPRIEEAEIRARIQTAPGQPLDSAQIARDVRAIFQQGFFRDVQVYVEKTPLGPSVIFEVSENPVVREIAISGNDEIDGDKIKDALTLTTGSPLDYPLLHENVERVAALYKSEGYYLAEVNYETEDITDGSVAINFVVEEKEKLKLKKIEFEGNEAFSDRELREGFSTKTWRFYSFATSWLDKTGTYSEPVFVRDLRLVEKLYTDDGYVQSRVIGPEVDAREEGLFVKVQIVEGPQFKVGTLDVQGDETIDLAALRDKIKLKQGDVFSRSSLTSDVEVLEAPFHRPRLLFRERRSGHEDEPGGPDRRRAVRRREGPALLRPQHRGQGQHAHDRSGDPARGPPRRGPALLGAGAPGLERTHPPPRLLRGRRLRAQDDRGSVAARPRRQRGRAADGRLQLRRRLLLRRQLHLHRLALPVESLRPRLRREHLGRHRRQLEPLFRVADRSLFPGLDLQLQRDRLPHRGPLRRLPAGPTGHRARHRPSAHRRQQRVDRPLATATRSARSGRTTTSTPWPRRSRARSSRATRAPAGSASRSASTPATIGSRRRRAMRRTPSWSTPVSAASRTSCARGPGAATTSARPRWLFERSTFVVSTRLGYAIPFNSIDDFDTGVQSSTACADPSNCINSATSTRSTTTSRCR